MAGQLRTRTTLLYNKLHETDMDIAVITETWLKDTDIDEVWLNQLELRQSNYDILLQNRPGPKKGDSIALACTNVNTEMTSHY